MHNPSGPLRSGGFRRIRTASAVTQPRWNSSVRQLVFRSTIVPRKAAEPLGVQESPNICEKLIVKRFAPQAVFVTRKTLVASDGCESASRRWNFGGKAWSHLPSAAREVRQHLKASRSFRREPPVGSRWPCKPSLSQRSGQRIHNMPGFCTRGNTLRSNVVDGRNGSEVERAEDEGKTRSCFRPMLPKDYAGNSGRPCGGHNFCGYFPLEHVP